MHLYDDEDENDEKDEKPNKKQIDKKSIKQTDKHMKLVFKIRSSL